MTVFLGMYNLSGVDIDKAQKKVLQQILETDVGDTNLFSINKKNFYCVSYDNGAYKVPGVIQNEESVTIVTGEPLIDVRNDRTRKEDTQLIHHDFLNNKLLNIKKSRGVFSGINCQFKNNSLNIFTDKLGIRPVYYYIKNNVCVFSSVLSYLQKLTFIDLEEDFEGICEIASMRFSLANRTQFKYIKLLQGGQFISIENNEFKIKSYWNWADAESSVNNTSKNEVDTDNISKQLFNVFDEAVKIRLGDEENAIAFLSGGLDSRSVTAALKKHTKNIHTFNFATEKSQDGEFAKWYSENLESKHYEVKMEKLSFPNWSVLIADAWKNTKISKHLQPLYPQKIWSGDGGSVGLGFVYLNHQIIEKMAERDFTGAVSSFIKFNKLGLMTQYISTPYRNRAKDLIFNGILNEIKDLKDIPDQHKFYLFLLFNDQQRHLFTHFETIGTHKIELVLPYFDSDFLSLILTLPTKQCLEHEFYMQWFNHFPDFVRKTPWQTYPGHKACPIKSEQELSYQWGNKQKLGFNNTLKMKNEANEVIMALFNDAMLKRYINRPLVFIKMLLHRFNVRDYSYVVEFVRKFSQT